MPRALLKLRVGLRGSGWRYEAHSLRSEAKHNICRLIYHLVHLTPLSPATAPFSSARTAVSVATTLFISELKARIIQAVLAAFARSAHKISFVLNPRRRHIRLRNEKILWFCADIFSQSAYLRLYVIFAIITAD